MNTASHLNKILAYFEQIFARWVPAFQLIFYFLESCGTEVTAPSHVKCIAKESFQKIGCFRTSLNGINREDAEDMEMLINDRDQDSIYNDGHIVNWKEFDQSTHR